MTSPVERDCRCPRARHVHGTRRAYQYDRCRCTPCRSAHAAAQATYRAGGTWRGDGPKVTRPLVFIDEVAVDQAMRGRTVRLTRPERAQVIARMMRRGDSAARIALCAGTSTRTVERRRQRPEYAVQAVA